MSKIIFVGSKYPKFALAIYFLVLESTVGNLASESGALDFSGYLAGLGIEDKNARLVHEGNAIILFRAFWQ